MGEDDDPDIEFHFVRSERTFEAITQRLREMQRELDERAPVDTSADDDEGPQAPVS